MKTPATLSECAHIDEVHLLVTKTRGLTGTAAEVGTASGRTALPLLRMFTKVYIVDLWPWSEQDYRDCMATLSEYKDTFTVLRGLSWEMAEQIPDESLDYVYIDADHKYESIKKDLVAYYPKLRSGVGAVASGHDYGAGHPGVNQAVDEFVVEMGLTEFNGKLGCSYAWAFTKP